MKGCENPLNNWIDKKKRDSKPYEHFGRNIKVELDLSNYATKVVLKGATGVNISNLAQNEI